MPDAPVESAAQEAHAVVRKQFFKWLLTRETQGGLSPKEQRDKSFAALDWDPELSPEKNAQMLRLRTPGNWVSNCFRIQKDATIFETNRWIDFYRRFRANDQSLLSFAELPAFRTQIERYVVASIASLRDRIERRFNSMWPDRARPQNERYGHLTSEIWVPIIAELEELEAAARFQNAVSRQSRIGERASSMSAALAEGGSGQDKSAVEQSAKDLGVIDPQLVAEEKEIREWNEDLGRNERLKKMIEDAIRSHAPKQELSIETTDSPKAFHADEPPELAKRANSIGEKRKQFREIVRRESPAETIEHVNVPKRVSSISSIESAAELPSLPPVGKENPQPAKAPPSIHPEHPEQHSEESGGRFAIDAVVKRKSAKRGKRQEPHPNPGSLFGRRQLQTFTTASTALGLSRRRLADLIDDGRLEAVGKGPARRITTKSLREYLQRPKNKSEESGRKRQ
jgi:hypothetical protein